MESAAAVVVSAAAAVVSAVELDPHPVNAEAATTAAIASAVTFFIISISPQLFFFVTSRCHFQDLYILPFRRDLTFSNALLRYALTHVSETVLIIHLYAGFVKLDFPVFTFSCYSTRALYARAL